LQAFSELPTGTPGSPRAAKSNISEGVCRNPLTNEFVPQATCIAKSKLGLHFRGEMAAPGECNKVRLDSTEEVPGR
jgi:hypothetical protein